MEVAHDENVVKTLGKSAVWRPEGRTRSND